MLRILTDKLKSGWCDLVIASGLGLLSFLVYFLTLSVGTFPGESARHVAMYLGLMPKVTLLWQGWSIVAWLFEHFFPCSDRIFLLNLLNAICGAISIAIFYRIMTGTLSSLIEKNPVNQLRVNTAIRIGAIVACLALAFSVPFWIVSNRAHPAGVDILLLLGAIWIILKYLETANIWYAYFFCFFYAVSMTEATTMIVFAPLACLLLLLLLTRDERLKPLILLKSGLFFLAGCSVYFILTWAFQYSPDYELREYQGFFHTLKVMLRDQLFAIAYSIPPKGWLTILVVSGITWFVCLIVGYHSLNGERDFWYYILHAVLTAIVVAVLCNTPIAPWQITRFERVVVTPYLLTAFSAGYLTAYWILFPWILWSEDKNSFIVRAKRVVLSSVAGASLLALVTILPFYNFAEADARPARFVNHFAKEVINSMNALAPDNGKRIWMVSSGFADDNVRIAGWLRGQEVHLLDLRASGDEVYIRHITRFLHAPRLRNLVQLGMIPLIQGWMEWDTTVDGKIAIFALPDLWIGAGYTVVPMKLLFLGTKTPTKLNPEVLMKEHEKFWKDNMVLMRSLAESSSPLAPFGKACLRHMSVVANNLGVLMEELGQLDNAFKCYNIALQIVPENISALLNLSYMVDSGYQTKQANEIKQKLEKLSSDKTRAIEMWGLSRNYGYVRRPEAFVGIGWTWALSGYPGLAVSGFKKALDLLPADKTGIPIKQTLAGIYLSQHELDASESLYGNILAQDPSNISALLGTARIFARRGDFAKAREFMERAEKTGSLPRITIAQEWALVYLLSGYPDRARILLEEVIAIEPKSIRANTLLLGTLVLQHDEKGLELFIQRTESIPRTKHLQYIARGHLALLKNKWEEAREHFDRALSFSPNDISILEQLLRLDTNELRSDLAHKHAIAILKLDPGNALANYIMGTLHYKDGHLDLAEDSFRRSLQREKTAYALNDLAWVLYKRNQLEEAERLARESISMDQQSYQAWDTLGMILLKQGVLDEAEKTLQRAVSMAPDKPETIVHLAELQYHKGNRERAKELLQVASKLRGRMSMEEQDTLDYLMRAVEGK